MVVFLRLAGYTVNRKRVQRLMQQMGLSAMAPGPHTSVAHAENKVYPYLLRGVAVVRPNQVWSTDITYSVPGAQGEYGYSNEPQVYLKYPVRAQGITVY